MKKKEETSEQTEVYELRQKSRMLGVRDYGVNRLGWNPSSAIP